MRRPRFRSSMVRPRRSPTKPIVFLEHLEQRAVLDGGSLSLPFLPPLFDTVVVAPPPAAVAGLKVMLPAKPDHRLVWLASNAHADAMVEHGVAVYRYSKGFLHQKVLLMDDRIATVGSVNFDNRSFAINFEMSVWMPSPRMVEAVAAMLETDFSACRLVTREEVQKRKPVRKLIESGARLFSPIL